MESDRPPRPDADAPRPAEPRPPGDASRAEWRALARLRERVETAAREIERLRAENADLAARLSAAGDGGPALPLEGDAGEVRAQIEGFIEAIDRVLEAGADSASPAAER